MKPFTDLNLGFTNAENYRLRANKNLLDKYFVRDSYLERLLNPNIYFLVGEKGTGKTAYSTYLRNNKYKGKNAFAYDVRQTEYQKFLELKRLGHLPLSQYSEVWRTLLLILSATSILEKSATPDFLRRFTRLAALKRAIDDFYNNAFAPEIIKILDFVESHEKSTSVLAKYGPAEGKIEGKGKTETKDSKSVFQTNLLKIRHHFEGAIENLHLDEDYIVFIDGIDVRPAEISYEDYFECVRGLIEAVWSINTDFLANIKDSKGRIRVVLLVRPDIFLRTGLHNVNTKIRDNSVVLNWMTSDKDYRGSTLFTVADRLLSAQQDESSTLGQAWDNYFQFNENKPEAGEHESERESNSFVSFMRLSYYRPRDISAMLGTMQSILTKKGARSFVTRKDFNDPSFRDSHADYLLGEIRDQLLFYYSQEEFDLFIHFFSHLKGKRKFSYQQFVLAMNEFVAECSDSGKSLPQFFESADIFLQFLYEQNVICYIETDDEDQSAERFVRWCFRERTPSNLSPKIRTNVNYDIFQGLTKALNVGRPIRTTKVNSSREFGTVIQAFADRKYGFIRGGAQKIDYYFKFDQLEQGYRPLAGDRVSYEPKIKYGKLRAHLIVRE